MFVESKWVQLEARWSAALRGRWGAAVAVLEFGSSGRAAEAGAAEEHPLPPPPPPLLLLHLHLVRLHRLLFGVKFVA